jgi:enamine deaminase RidA (YjgF/YER057c/UK114 family)
MAGYTKYFGTKDQPKKPARSALQVAALAAPGVLVEIEVIAVRPH